MSIDSNFVLWQRNQTLEARIAELEAELELDYHHKEQVRQSCTIVSQAEHIKKLEAQVEALKPKPVVVSRWCNIYYEPRPSDWFTRLADAKFATSDSVIGRLRKDTITHPDGRVEYRLEVEND